MPMNFPDSDVFPASGSLINAAQVHGFRTPLDGESQDAFRSALADHVQLINFVESCEIRNKIGWDQWGEAQNQDMLRRSGFDISREGE